MDHVDEVVEVVNQFGLVIHEAQLTYGPATVITALVHCAGQVAGQLEKQRPGAGQLWREQFEDAYRIEMERV